MPVSIHPAVAQHRTIRLTHISRSAIASFGAKPSTYSVQANDQTCHQRRPGVRRQHPQRLGPCFCHQKWPYKAKRRDLFDLYFLFSQ